MSIFNSVPNLGICEPIWQKLTIKEENEDSMFSLEEVKSYLRVCGANDDDLIISLMKSAKRSAESYIDFTLSSKLISVVYLSESNCWSLELPHSNVLSIENISISSNNCVFSPIDPKNYNFEPKTQLLCYRSSPGLGLIEVIYRTKEISEFHELYYQLKNVIMEHINIIYKSRGLNKNKRQIQSLYAQFSNLLR